MLIIVNPDIFSSIASYSYSRSPQLSSKSSWSVLDPHRLTISAEMLKRAATMRKEPAKKNEMSKLLVSSYTTPANGGPIIEEIPLNKNILSGSFAVLGDFVGLRTVRPPLVRG